MKELTEASSCSNSTDDTADVTKRYITYFL
jgi:hypothetical protein